MLTINHLHRIGPSLNYIETILYATILQLCNYMQQCNMSYVLSLKTYMKLYATI